MLARRLLSALLSGLALLACSAPRGAPQNAGGMSAAAGGETSAAGSETSAGGDASVAGSAGFGGNAGSSCSEDTPPNAWPSWPMPDPTSQGSATSQHYTESGPDVAIDDVTQLSWQRQLSGSTYTWEEARQYCDCLTLGAHDDWHMPSRIELLSIVDFTRQDPALDASAFPDTPFEWFWSASPVAGSDSDVWYVAFFDGNTHTSAKDSQYRVRCVRRAVGDDRHFTPQADETVADAATGLTWQRAMSPAQLSWADAKQYCSELPLSGGGFRLPNMKELQSLIDESSTAPAIDSVAFPETPSEGFWAATALAGMPTAAWFVNFASGVSYNSLVERTYRARCVR
jgi:Protein of unknown function (DUF1566)